MFQKAFYFLLYTLTFSTLVGIIFSSEIITLLFERGAFNRQDSASTALILQMYLIGLLPFGLSKLFSLWLYAKQRQKEAAKIATYVITTNIVTSLLLIAPFEAAGLAFASSLSGFVSLFLTLQSFKIENFLAIIHKKMTLYLVIGTLMIVPLLLGLRELLHVYL